MATLSDDRLSDLRAKIALQQKTIKELKRDGHEHTDAERQLKCMLADLKVIEDAGAADVRPPSKGAARSTPHP